MFPTDFEDRLATKFQIELQRKSRQELQTNLQRNSKNRIGRPNCSRLIRAAGRICFATVHDVTKDSISHKAEKTNAFAALILAKSCSSYAAERNCRQAFPEIATKRLNASLTSVADDSDDPSPHPALGLFGPKRQKQSLTAKPQATLAMRKRPSQAEQ